MDFARKILTKYGWKDGDGLGKNNDGIAKPLKATLKFDNAGFGADQAAADFNNHWWERVFNEAASNVDIRKDGERVKVDLKDENDGVEISTKGYSMKKLKKAKQSRKVEKGYDNFLQAVTLTNQGNEVENPDKINADDIEVTKVKVLTDEELFKACGGRTAHKGARHGLKLSGKLSRIEQQEAELLAKMMAKRNNFLADYNSISKTQEEDSSKCIADKQKDRTKLVTKKKHKNKEKPLEECETKQQEDRSNEPLRESSKLIKKKRKHCEEETVKENPTDLEKQTVQNKKIKKKKISKCTGIKASEDEYFNIKDKTEVPELKKKLKKKQKVVEYNT